MNIITFLRYRLTSQRGATAIMSAIILPLILAFGGIAVDIGNFYSHYSRLQNAADSAAMAGGHAFRKYQENAEEHPKSDEAAEEYTYKNVPTNVNVLCEGRRKNGYSMLKITLTEEVPYIFLKPLFEFMHRGEADYKAVINISASAYCTLIDTPSTGSQGNIFDNLFLFDYRRNPWYEPGSYALTLTNNVQNPDNPYLAQSIYSCSTFDGPVRAATQKAYASAIAGDNLRHNVMLTKDAFEYKSDITVAEAKANTAGRDGKEKTDDDLTNPILYESDIDITEYYRTTITKMMEADSTEKISTGNATSSDSINTILNNAKNNDKSIDAIYYNTWNLDITFNKAIDGKPTDRPLYVICNVINNFNFSADMTQGRPLVLVYTGSDKLTFNGSGGSYTGVIYAPYGEVFINDNGLHFDGSIVSQGIQTQSNGYYTHDINYTLDPDNDDSGNVKVVFGGADAWDD